MRGADVLQESMFSVKRLNDYLPAAHPMRPIRNRVNAALKATIPQSLLLRADEVIQ